MALLFAESFEHSNTIGVLGTEWGSTTLFIDPSTSYGRFGTKGCLFGGNRPLALYPDKVGNQTTAIAGFAAYFETFVGRIAAVHDATGAGYQASVYLAGDGSIIGYRGDIGTLLGQSAPGVVPLHRWVYIEVKFTIDNASGVIQVKIDGTTVLNLTSQDTQATANAFFNAFYLNAQSDYMFVDDFYLLDTTGGAPTNDFLGDVRVEALFPNGNGNSSQWVGQDANSTDNYLNVDEATDPDGDSTYNESSTVGDKDTYAYTNMTSTTGTVYGVQVLPYSRKTDAGTRKIVSVARLSGTETDSADKVLAASYAYQHDMRETKPGGGAWTISDVNSAEFGVKVSA